MFTNQLLKFSAIRLGTKLIFEPQSRDDAPYKILKYYEVTYRYTKKKR